MNGEYFVWDSNTGRTAGVESDGNYIIDSMTGDRVIVLGELAVNRKARNIAVSLRDSMEVRNASVDWIEKIEKIIGLLG